MHAAAMTYGEQVAAARVELLRHHPPEQVDAWLRAPNPRLNFDRPIDVILDGRGDLVLRLIREWREDA